MRKSGSEWLWTALVSLTGMDSVRKLKQAMETAAGWFVVARTADSERRTHMKRAAGVFLAAVLVMSCFAAAWAVEQVQRSSLLTTRATVEAVDQANRMVTLKGPEGNTFEINAGDNVRNLEQIKPGDQVMVRYYESLLVQMAKPGGQPTSSATGSVERAMPGEKPGGSAVRQITTTATVVGVDRGNSEVMLQGPRGNVVTVKAADPANIENLKKGDQINITYTQAMAISVEEAKG